MLKDRHLIVPDGGLLKGLTIKDEIVNSYSRVPICLNYRPCTPTASDPKLEVTKCQKK